MAYGEIRSFPSGQMSGGGFSLVVGDMSVQGALRRLTQQAGQR